MVTFFLQHDTVFIHCESQFNSYTITKQPCLEKEQTVKDK